MKKLLVLFAGLFTLLSAHAQLSNPGFEQWDTTATLQAFPHRWPSLMEQYCNRSTDAYQGDYALTVSVWYYYVKTTATQQASIDYKPSYFTGYYKYTDNYLHALGSFDTIVDTALVSIYLTRWDTAAGRRDTIGYGTLPLMQSLAYNHFSCPVRYSSAVTPDSVEVSLDPSIMRRYVNATTHNTTSNTGYGSFLTIDALALEGRDSSSTTGIWDIPQNTDLQIYPNPATDRITITQKNTDAQSIIITDAIGRTCISSSIDKEITTISVSELHVGLYLINLANKEGKTIGIRKFIKD